MDIYRDGAPIKTDFTGTTYDDHIDKKGGGSYEHDVCVSGTAICSNTTTTLF